MIAVAGQGADGWPQHTAIVFRWIASTAGIPPHGIDPEPAGQHRSLLTLQRVNMM
jgi:hypothetical protein